MIGHLPSYITGQYTRVPVVRCDQQKKFEKALVVQSSARDRACADECVLRKILEAPNRLREGSRKDAVDTTATRNRQLKTLNEK